jgi:DNA-binding SARP family transcriptional activator
VDFRILGPFEVCDGDQHIPIGPPKQRAVLAVLLVHANQVVAVDRLIDLLWGEEPPARAGGALQAYMHNLRRVLEPARPRRSPPVVLVTQAPGYVLRVGPDELDATRFEALAAEGRRLLAESRPETARQRLAEALALWRGPAPLPEFAHEPFAQAAAARLKELREVAIEDRLEAELATGWHVEAVAELEVLVGQHPLRPSSERPPRGPGCRARPCPAPHPSRHPRPSTVAGASRADRAAVADCGLVRLRPAATAC